MTAKEIKPCKRTLEETKMKNNVIFYFIGDQINPIETELNLIPNKKDIISFDDLKFDFGEYCYDVFKVKEVQWNFDINNKLDRFFILLEMKKK